MPRRIKIGKAEIYQRRLVNWEYHYNNHRIAQAVAESQNISAVISRFVPVPEMSIDGGLLKGGETVAGIHRVLDELHWSHQQHDLVCAWYWSESGWDCFVRGFQSLPDVEEDYYLFYDAEKDMARFMPMSSKAKRGDVPKLVDNLWRKQVQVGRSRYISPEIEVLGDD